MSEPSLPFTQVRDGVTIEVRVGPRAACQRIGKVADEANGPRVIKISVTAPFGAGKANDAVIRLLAKAWQVPKTSLLVASGAANRRKTIHAPGNTEDLFRRLSERMESHYG